MPGVYGVAKFATECDSRTLECTLKTYHLFRYLYRHNTANRVLKMVLWIFYLDTDSSFLHVSVTKE